jgi:peptidoglycan/LPS O-acetylase OafA/YrhL
MSLWGRTTSRFLISRAARLYPAYWVAVTLTTLTVVGVGVTGRSGVSLPQYLVNMTMFAGPVNVTYVEGVYWTLWSEWRFYALLFIFSLVGLTLKRTHLFMWGWLAASVLLGVLPLPGSVDHMLALVIQPVYSHYFIAGIALYLVYRFGWTRNLVLLLLCSYAHAVYQGMQHAKRLDAVTLELSAAAVAAIVTVLFVIMTLVATGTLSRWSSPRLTWLGEITYPLYLLHCTIGYALFNWLFPAVNRWILLVGIISFMCVTSWAISRHIERRLQPVMRAVLSEAWDSTRAQMARLHGRLLGSSQPGKPIEPIDHAPAEPVDQLR